MLRFMLSNVIVFVKMLAPLVLLFAGVVLIGNAARLVEKACFDTAVEQRLTVTTESVDIEVVVMPGANDEEAVLFTDLLEVGTKVPMPVEIFADYIRGREEQITLFVKVSDDVRFVAERNMLAALRDAGVPLVVSYAEQDDCVALLNIEPVVKPAAAVAPAAKVEPQYRRDARQAAAVAGLVNQMGRGLQRHPNPFVAVTAVVARQVAVQVQVAAMADLDLISPNPVVAMGQGFLIGF